MPAGSYRRRSARGLLLDGADRILLFAALFTLAGCSTENVQEEAFDRDLVDGTITMNALFGVASFWGLLSFFVVPRIKDLPDIDTAVTNDLLPGEGL